MDLGLGQAQGLEGEQAGLGVHEDGGLDGAERDVVRRRWDRTEPLSLSAEVGHRGLDLWRLPLADLA
jgi:hypothetical protein